MSRTRIAIKAREDAKRPPKIVAPLPSTPPPKKSGKGKKA